MKLITYEDLRDLQIKISQRGYKFIFSKLNFRGIKRTISSFNTTDIQSSNWWQLKTIRDRWNKLITGDENYSYEEFISFEVFKEYKSFNIISIGSGVCSHEIKLAELNPHWSVLCVDISSKLIEKAKIIALNKKISNINFICANIYKLNLPQQSFDCVFFHSSLHHFKNIENFLAEKIIKLLRPSGKLIINEYVGVNRLQFKKNQLSEINNCLNLIDKKYRLIFNTNIYKNKYYGSGILRMIISDPSECVDSINILPSINKYFNIIVQRPFGGNILMSVLKDIAHHFEENDKKKMELLKKIMKFEDDYLLNNKSDFMFGVYELKDIY